MCAAVNTCPHTFTLIISIPGTSVMDCPVAWPRPYVAPTQPCVVSLRCTKPNKYIQRKEHQDDQHDKDRHEP